MAFALNKELIFLIRQFCDEENLPKTVHMFEQETGCFFDMKYFEGLVLSGNWNEAESYLSGFTTLKDNLYSRKIYFELRKHKYLEALDIQDVTAALEILRKDLKVFASSNADLYKEMALLLTMDDFRTHHSLSHYGDVTSARKHVWNEIKTFIEENPEFNKKLEFPLVEKSRLRRLVNQSLNWQHAHCAYPQSEPQIKTLFTDHKCFDQSTVQNPLPSRSMSAVSSSSVKFSSLPSVPELDVFSDLPLECITDSGDVSNGNSNMSMNESIWEQMVSLQSKPVPNQNPESDIPVSLPTTIERCVNVGASPNSIDFHPVKETIILVGSSTGDIELWDIGPETKLFRNAFMIWDREAISSTILDDLDKDPSVSVNRVLWCPDGSLFGVAHSKHIVHLYSYDAKTSYTEKHLEVVAHFGGINDLAFSSPEGQLLVITCGDDKLIQVWDTSTGSKQYTFEGHGDSVCSLCPHVKEDIHFLFSTSINGEIKAWLFDDTRPKVHYTAPGHSCMRMAYSADGQRLFSCGTNKAGESFIVEWDESDGYIIQTYNGLSVSSANVVQFSMSMNQFLAAGDEHVIKIWDVDNVDVLAVIEAGGDLPASPCLCFNKTGTLLAVSADTTKIKILANDVGHRILQNSSCFSCDIHVNLSKSLKKLDIDSVGPTRVRADDEMLLMGENLESPVRVELNGVLGSRKRSTILDVSSCRSLRLPSDVKTSKICRLTYTNSGNGIVALSADGIHLVWRWPGHDSTKYGRATTNYPPQQCRQKSGLLMINDLNDDSVQSVSSCFALSKNDSYLVSGSGKTVSVFNTVTFKKMRSCILPPSIATCISFYPPDNNIIVIGMDDSTILVYNVRLAEITNRLKGHTKPVTGFAFSTKFEVLVSSGFDTQLIVWDYTTWEKKDNTLLEIPSNWSHVETSETNVQFLQDQKHFLAVHATQLVIYETTKLERVQQWMIGNFCTRISHATISSDNELVYALMKDGIVLILNASDLSPAFEINPCVYLPSDISSRVEPVVVASNPQKPNQFALGLTDGGVIVIEPHELQGKWTM